MSSRVKLLLVGPLPIEDDVVGGTKVSFAALVAALERSERFDVDVLDVSRARVGRGLLRRALGGAGRLATLLAALATPRKRRDVVLWNVSSGGALLAAPLVLALCRLRGARLAVRVFGGDLDLALARAARPLRAAARSSLLAADLLLLQTRALCAAFDAPTTRWWPTTRDLVRTSPATRPSARRFLFLGQLRREKGVADALEAARALPEGATLTVHGPRMPGFDVDPLLSAGNVELGGPLAPADVQPTLEAHDVLVFPSTFEGEGLPGVVVEALQLGLPVVASAWRSLPELVEHEACGLLVPPRDVPALGAALRRLAEDDALFHVLRAGALAAGARHRGADWTPQLVEWLSALGRGEAPGAGADPARTGALLAREEAA